MFSGVTALHVLAQLCVFALLPSTALSTFLAPKKEILVMWMPLLPGFNQLAVDALAPQKVSCLLCVAQGSGGSGNPVSRAKTSECSAFKAWWQKIKAVTSPFLQSSKPALFFVQRLAVPR